MVYLRSPIPVAGEDGDSEGIRHAIAEIFEASEQLENTIAIDKADGEFHDGVGIVEFIRDKTLHAFCDMLDKMDADINEIPKPTIVTPIVSYSGHQIYKSTLVSQLNGNPFFSKDGLTRVKNSIYFYNSDDYLNAANSTETQLLGLGSNCAVILWSELLQLNHLQQKQLENESETRPQKLDAKPASKMEGTVAHGGLGEYKK